MSSAFRFVLRIGVVVFVVLFLVFIALQFFRPAISNPPAVADFQAPEPIKKIIRTSCYDCHSNETKLTWYDQIVPAYWIVADDIKKGRQNLNFSEFSNLPPAKQKGILYEAVNQIQLGAMPFPSYKFVHPESAITPEQLAVLKQYLHPKEDLTVASAEQTKAATDQFERWVLATDGPSHVNPAPNGLEFFPDFKNWKLVSATDRYDNGTMRLILGNDIAIQAISENKIQPWPDGAAFAKIAWNQQLDEHETVRPGEFKQVEFMVKNAGKYTSTDGWGWGRWLGASYVPYGKESSFSEECMSCHLPVQKNDFVYTMPIMGGPPAGDLFNRQPALSGNLPFQPFQWRLITSSIDKNKSAMSVLCGNDIAVDHARKGEAYPPGSVLASVTWGQQEDVHWFGGNIPAMVQSVEFVTIGSSPGNEPSYQLYEGSPLKASTVDADVAKQRLGEILNRRASVMP